MLGVIGGGVAAGAALAHHPGQRLARIVTVRQQWVMSEPLEIRLRQLFVRMRRGDGCVQPDARHLLQHPVGHPDAGHLPVPGRYPRPCLPPGRVHRAANPPQRLIPSRCDLVQRPPRRRHRRDQAEQVLLVAHHPEIADHLRPVSDRAGQVRQHPAPVMH